MNRFSLCDLSSFQEYKEIVQITKDINLYPLLNNLICGRPFFFNMLKIKFEGIEANISNHGKII